MAIPVAFPESSIEAVASFMPMQELPSIASVALIWRDAVCSNAVWAAHHAAILRQRFVACEASTGWSPVAQDHVVPAVFSVATADTFRGSSRRIARALSVKASQRTRRFSTGAVGEPLDALAPTKFIYMTSCGTELLICHDAGERQRGGVAHWAVEAGTPASQLSFFGGEGLETGVMVARESGKSLQAISGWQSGKVMLADVRSGAVLTAALPSAVGTMDVDQERGNVFAESYDGLSTVHKLGPDLALLCDRPLPAGQSVSKMRYCGESRVLFLAIVCRGGADDGDQREGLVELWSDGLGRLKSVSPGLIADVAGIGPMSDAGIPGVLLLALHEAASSSSALLRLDARPASRPSDAPILVQRLRDNLQRVLAMCVAREERILLGTAVGSLVLLDASDTSAPARLLAEGSPHVDAIFTVIHIAGLIVSSAYDNRIVVSSARPAGLLDEGPGEIRPLRYIECDGPAWSSSFTVHRAAFAGTAVVTTLEFLSLPGPEVFGLVPGTPVRLQGLAGRPDLNGALGVVADQSPSAHPQSSRDRARGRVPVQVGDLRLSAAVGNLRFEPGVQGPQGTTRA